MTALTEGDVEQAALAWLHNLGWRTAHGPDIAPGAPDAERADYGEAILPQRLRDALARLNPDLPADALDDAFRQLTRPQGTTLEARNRAFHRMAVDGVTVEYRDANGAVRGDQARVIDFDDPANNDWLAVNQFTVVENRHERRPDVVLFVNGLPLAVVELKNPADEEATIWTAWQQLQTYKAEIPSLFAFNAALVVSDGLDARIGTLTAGREWFKPWRTITGEALADPYLPQLQVMIEGVCEPKRFLALLRDFIVVEDDGGALVKKMAGYHQFHAVQTAVDETLRAAALQREAAGVAEAAGRYESGRQAGGEPGDRRIGVVWHTQGSGKSLTMAFYVGRIIREPAMHNPTLVVLTDRNDLDDQLFSTFARCQDLLRQPPVQATNRADLRARLAVESGGVVFTTIQKFMPPGAAPSPRPSPRGRGGEAGDRHLLLSERRNVVVIADEAHRSQYDFIDGYARHMRDALPNASFIGFTGTPIELADASTRAVFGDHISVYDIQRAVQDGATVPIYYESRLARLALDERERPDIDPDFEEATEGEEIDRKEKLKTKWAQLEAIVGAGKRLKLVAEDIVAHFDSRSEAMDGKAMVVCMSRRICIDLYRELVRLRPDWHDDGDESGAIKVVMTGAASDPPDWQPHVRNKPRREALAKRFRDPGDPLRVVLVRDMWLTGFDAPSLHTMYVDKPMRGHGLMKAIARVNRVFRDKPGGLVVDYLGLAHELKRALATYTESGGTGETALDQGQAVAVMREKYEICCGLFHGFDRSAWVDGAPAERLGPAARGTRTRAGAGQRQGALPEGGAGVVASLCPGRAARGGAAHSRRHGVLSGRARGAGQACRRPGAAAGGPRSRRAPDRLARRGAGGGDGHLRRCRLAEAGYLDPVRRFSGRGAGHAAAQLGGGVAAEAFEGRAGVAESPERRAGAVVRRPAGADHSPLPEPRRRSRAGDRGVDRAGPRSARGGGPGRKAGPVGRRARLLRRAGNQRQCGAGARRRDAARHRPRVGGHRAEQRHHRLDATRERARQSTAAGPARPAQARLPAGQAGEGNPDGAGAGGGVVRRLGGVIKLPAGAAALTHLSRVQYNAPSRVERCEPPNHDVYPTKRYPHAE